MPDVDMGDEDEIDPADVFDAEPETLEDPEDFEHFLEILWAILNGGDVFQVRYVIPPPPGEEGGESGPGDLSEEQDDSEGAEGPEGGSSEQSEDDDEDEQDDEQGDEGHTADGPRLDEEGEDADQEDDADDAEDDNDRGSDDSEHGGSSGSHSDQGEDAEEGMPFTQDDLDEMLQDAEEERWASTIWTVTSRRTAMRPTTACPTSTLTSGAPRPTVNWLPRLSC